jgi:nucleoside-diphosphate-sugar epimerase
VTRVAILGAHGFLGAPIAAAFSQNGYDVVSFSRTKKRDSLFREYQVDIFNSESLKLALIETKPNIVISTAWDTEHGKFWTNESNSRYQDSTLKFAELSFENGVESFLGLGTMSEYGTNPGICNAENSPLISSDIYSTSKIETGRELRLIGERFGLKTNWLRVFQAFGPNEKAQRFIPGLISTLRQKENFAIRTPNYEMDWIHTSDIATATLFVLENKLDHFVDVGTGIGTTVKDLSELVCAELDLDFGLLDYSNQTPGHERKVIVDQNALLFSSGWRPAESLESRINSLR